MNTDHTSRRKRRHPFIKVCGQTYTGSVDCAAAYGAEYVGFNFCLGSPRFVTPRHAGHMKSAFMKRVGVFARQSAAEILEIMGQADLHLAQLAGGQDTDEAAAIGVQRVIRTLRVPEDATVECMQAEIDAWEPFCCCYMVECGKASLLRKLRFPHPWILSGRMEAGRLQRMLHMCRPDGVDIDSGVGSADTMAAMRAVS